MRLIRTSTFSDITATTMGEPLVDSSHHSYFYNR